MSEFIKQQSVLQSSVATVSRTLSVVDEQFKNWPIKPTGNSAYDNQEICLNLSKYSDAFQAFSDKIDPKECQKDYKTLVDLRAQVSEARKKFNYCKANKASLGAEAVLKEATNLRMLMTQLLGHETEFIYKLMNQWKNAISDLASGLKEIGNTKN